jgi:hypothetical protein
LTPEEALERLGTMCLAYDGVSEKLSHGERAFFVRGRQFLTTADRHHDDRVGFWAAAAPLAQEILVSNEPELYFRPPYVGHRGWLGYRFDRGAVDWGEVAAICEDAYRTVAPKKLVAELDS